MCKFVVMLLVAIGLLSGTVSAKTTLEVMPTYRYDRFIWNKADIGGYPNVLSELKWEELRIRGIKGVVRQDWGQRFFGEIVGSYGRIYSGHNRDSDYEENDRQGEFSRTYASASGGTVVDGSLAVGWKWQANNRAQTNLLGGYAINRQMLTMHDGV